MVTEPPEGFTAWEKFADLVRKKNTLVSRIVLTGISAILDAILWIIVVFVLAGPIIASAIYEALFDHFVLVRVQNQIDDKSWPIEHLLISHALVALLIGSFRQTQGIGGATKETMQHAKTAPSKLRQLVKLVPTFGDTIVGPSLFFLGAFLFTLLGFGMALSFSLQLLAQLR
jgi:hypothetical protein